MDYSFLAIGGHQPSLSIAELERLHGADAICPIGALGCLTKDQPDISKLGGTVKVARLLEVVSLRTTTSIWPLIERAVEDSLGTPSKKCRLGLSFYGVAAPTVSEINRHSIGLCRQLRANRLRVRAVPNREIHLSSAAVWHNRLDKTPNIELIIALTEREAYLARTIAVQDLEGFARRDYSKPVRSPRIGMLPPKLARLMINLADPDGQQAVLDPFCGSGTVLMESTVMGRATRGSDISPEMVEASRTNMQWLSPVASQAIQLEQADAQTHQWTGFKGVVVSEMDLGPPLSLFPSPVKLRLLRDQAIELAQSFLTNVTHQSDNIGTICLATPAWYDSRSNRLTGLELFDWLKSLGYNLVEFKHVDPKHLIYRRPQQIVARQLILIRR